MTYFEPKNQENSRILEILNQINKIPGIHNNALKKIIVDEKKIMAKRTFDKLIKELRSQGRIQIISMGDNKLHYTLPAPITGETIDFEKQFEPYLQSLESRLKELKKIYKKLPIQGKQSMIISSLSTVFSSMVGISLMRSISEPSTETLTKQEIRLRNYVKGYMDIIMHDKDANLVIGIVTDSILTSFTAIQFLQLLKINQLPQ